MRLRKVLGRLPVEGGRTTVLFRTLTAAAIESLLEEGQFRIPQNKKFGDRTVPNVVNSLSPCLLRVTRWLPGIQA